MKNISKSSFTSMTNAIPTRWHYCMNFPPYMRFVTIVKYFFVLHVIYENLCVCACVCVRTRSYLMIYSTVFNRTGLIICLYNWDQYYIFVKTDSYYFTAIFQFNKLYFLILLLFQIILFYIMNSLNEG